MLQCLITRWRAPAAAALLALGVAGCGGGSDAGPSQAQAPLAAPPLRALPNADSADLLMNFGEAGFSQYFPSHQPTQTWFSPFEFRYYPATGTYLGVVVQPSSTYTPGGVYVMGGGFGGGPTYVGLLGHYVFAWDTPGASWDETPWQ